MEMKRKESSEQLQYMVGGDGKRVGVGGGVELIAAPFLCNVSPLVCVLILPGGARRDQSYLGHLQTRHASQMGDGVSSTGRQSTPPKGRGV